MPRPQLLTNTQSNAVCVHTSCQHTGRYYIDRIDGSTVCATCHATLKKGKWSA